MIDRGLRGKRWIERETRNCLALGWLLMVGGTGKRDIYLVATNQILTTYGDGIGGEEGSLNSRARLREERREKGARNERVSKCKARGERGQEKGLKC